MLDEGKGDARASETQQAPAWANKALIFGAVGLVWFTLDTLTKSWLNGSYAQGDVITGPILGLVRFHLVHNTGAAWGMFGDSTLLLGVMSLLVCAALVAYLFVLSPRASKLEIVGVALVVAGGLGNALDRFLLGYVVDFIEPVFIDFPVFNIADIGVTCGFVLFIIGLFMNERRLAAEQRAALQTGETSAAAEEEKVDGK